MDFIALRRGCSESKLAFPGFWTSLLLLGSEFSSNPTVISQAENDHSSCINILPSEQKLFGEVISCLAPLYSPQQVRRTPDLVLNFGDLVRVSVLLHYYVPASQWVPVSGECM